MKVSTSAKIYNKHSENIFLMQNNEQALDKIVVNSWEKAGKFWPLQSIIAANPLSGLECHDFEEAINFGAALFQTNTMSESLQKINLETIKWLQVFFDENQALFKMPLKGHGLYRSVKKMLMFDKVGKANKKWLQELPDSYLKTIKICLVKLNVASSDIEILLTVLIAALPGWSAFIKQKAESENSLLLEYLALRLILTCITTDDYLQIVTNFFKENSSSKAKDSIQKIKDYETRYYNDLLEDLKTNTTVTNLNKSNLAQLLFCIDPRSEPIRAHIESHGFETFGCAGFFGLPVAVTDNNTGRTHKSCPIFVPASHTVQQNSKSSFDSIVAKINELYVKTFKTLKYNILSAFGLAEAIGPFFALSSIVKGFVPLLYARVKNFFVKTKDYNIDLCGLDIESQLQYAKGLLSSISLTKDFAKLVVICGHGSTTENNAFASSLDCGACGGHKGHSNSLLLAKILNDPTVRTQLSESDIKIPEETLFVAALHDTSSNIVEFFSGDLTKEQLAIKADLQVCLDKFVNPQYHKASHNWSNVRPESGLAKNASLIIGPRELTQGVNLEARTFLHSYDPSCDPDGSLLKVILGGPLVVASWINLQYLFSTLDNVAYGGGSKMTVNITGGAAPMQGNASDIMHGLPMQSVMINSGMSYHKPIRLMAVIYANPDLVLEIVNSTKNLSNLLNNNWVKFVCISPDTKEHVFLN